MSHPKIEAPANLEAWELELDGDVYVLFAWGAPATSKPTELTPAEQGVLRGILRGESNAVIAKHRRTRPRTVANQIASLFRKLGVRSRNELIARMVCHARA